MTITSSGKKAGCPVCGKYVTTTTEGFFWPHCRPTYRYAGSVPCEGVTMRNDDPLVDDYGRLVWRAAKAREAIDVLPTLIAEARKKLDALDADLARAPAVAESTAAELDAWVASHPKGAT